MRNKDLLPIIAVAIGPVSILALNVYFYFAKHDLYMYMLKPILWGVSKGLIIGGVLIAFWWGLDKLANRDDDYV